MKHESFSFFRFSHRLFKTEKEKDKNHVLMSAFSTLLLLFRVVKDCLVKITCMPIPSIHVGTFSISIQALLYVPVVSTVVAPCYGSLKRHDAGSLVGLLKDSISSS